jgi:hypothetical protein
MAKTQYVVRVRKGRTKHLLLHRGMGSNDGVSLCNVSGRLSESQETADLPMCGNCRRVAERTVRDLYSHAKNLYRTEGEVY